MYGAAWQEQVGPKRDWKSPPWSEENLSGSPGAPERIGMWPCGRGATLWRRAPGIALAFFAVVAVQVVVIGSYDTWWGGASFGARRFINCTILFAVDAAAAFGQLRGTARRVGAVGVVLLILWNFGLAVQYSVGLIPRDAPVQMSQVAYNQLFEVPPRMAQIAWRFAFDRSSLYRTR